ncbi:MAG: EamA family transporter [Ferrovibrio sp.]|uniref:DMT family transporter n=1 Tax=Ferrovibrio sp. TaxID=1917215 RepID=UPI0026399C7D|nr:EamA family transporter [Ferrovibrio sp.]MCW0235160.1 EamA family transporter [Ferrovibrio sp.]
MTWYYVALGVSILLGLAGQLMLKAGASGETLLQQLLAPQSIIGLMLYGTAAFSYMYALRRIPVSIAFPSVSLSYVLVALLGFWLYGEALTMSKLAGIALVCAGVFLITRTA